MWDMDLNVLNAALAAMVLLLLTGGCTPQLVAEAPIEVQIYQNWELQPGDAVAGYSVMGGLGDISITLNGNTVYRK